MSAALAISAGKAKGDAASSCGRSRNFLRFGPRIVETARGIFPFKTARYLADLTGDPVRTWEYWLSNERLSSEAMGALLASEYGQQFIDAIANESRWWRSVREGLALADKRKHAMEEAANALRVLAETEASEDVRVPDVVGGCARAVVSRTAAKAKR